MKSEMNSPLEQQLYYALKDGNTEEFKYNFIKTNNGCLLRPYDKSLVLHAVLENQLDILSFLIQQGCDINQADDSGMTPLHAAAINNNVKAVEILLSANAEVDIEDKFGNTPLAQAVFSCKEDIAVVKLLFERGANPSHSNINGSSPISFAIKTKKKPVVDLLSRKK